MNLRSDRKLQLVFRMPWKIYAGSFFVVPQNNRCFGKDPSDHLEFHVFLGAINVIVNLKYLSFPVNTGSTINDIQKCPLPSPCEEKLKSKNFENHKRLP